MHMADSARCAWITVEHPLPCGEPELRVGYSSLKILLRNKKLIDDNALIIYLGHDRLSVDPKDPTHKKLVRRVMINENTAVILGHNFRYFEPHPDFK